MNAVSDPRPPHDPPPAPRAADHAPRVRTLLICDLADSTALVERLGDSAGAELIRRHDRVARDLLQRFHGREIDKTDGFLALFERPVEAVGFALQYLRALRQLGAEVKQDLRARVGIHVGEVVLWENTRAEVAAGAKPLEVEGLAKPVVARLMSLALPGQILLSGVAFTIAQRAEGELATAAPLRWLTHGRYHFKGVPAPMLVHEVGEPGIAPLQTPPSGDKAQRDVPFWRRPAMLGVEGLLLLAAVAIPAWLSLRAPTAIAFAERDWVVVGELRNLTGETLLDDSLQTAFRISLEQSRHVNVLPDLKLHDALARMQRPADTAIDRAVASEIALREGARAVILPTVAEVGGRVRVSAEVVDPHTQTTVYAESADGVGAASALDSIDAVTHDLRARLGEALAAIENDSAPLPKVTSGNLDALRAYALGYKAYMRADFQEALGLYEQALALDPGFAQARVGMARIRLAGDDLPGARRLMAEALSDAQRLPARERLYVEAFGAVLEHRPDAVERWDSLIAVYPDFFPPYYNSALYAFERGNRSQQALATALRGVDSRNPANAPLHYLIGFLYLNREDYAKAEDYLQQARALGSDASGWAWAKLYGAQRRFDEAEAAVARFKLTGLPVNDAYGYITAAVVAADRGELVLAQQRLAEGAELAERASPQHERAFALAALALRELHDEPVAYARALRSGCTAEAKAVAAADLAARPQSAFALAWCAAAAARQGLGNEAAAWLEASRGAMHGLDHPVALQMQTIAQAQLLLAGGDADGAVRTLEEVADGSMLVAAHVLDVEARAAAGAPEEAIAAAERLAAARGAAYTEFGSNHVLQPRNALDTTLALLRLAELRQAGGDRAASRAALQRFRAAWPAERWPVDVRRRVAQLGDAPP